MGGGGGGGCCVGNCGFCCVANCGFCCVGDFCSHCGGDCCVGNCSHCSDSSSSGGGGYVSAETNRTIIIANEIAAMVDRADKDGKKQEDEIITEINESMANFIEWLKEINRKTYNGVSLNINVSKIEELNIELRNKVIGSIGEKLKSRLIQTDPELSIILSEPDNKKRKKNFEDFYNARFREAIRAMITVVEDSIREQSMNIEQEIQNRLAEVNAGMREETLAFEELQNLKAQEDSRLAEKRVEYMYYENLCDVMFDQLSSGKK